MNEGRGKEITKIYPTKWEKDNRKNFVIYTFGFIVSFFYPYHAITESVNIYYQIIIYTGFIGFCFGFIFFFSSTQYEPLSLYENGIIPYETKMKVKLFGKREIIHFSNIKAIVNYGKEKNWLSIKVILKNGKYIFQNVDSNNDFNLIKKYYIQYQKTKSKS